MKVRIKKNDLKIKRSDYRYFENGVEQPPQKFGGPSKDYREFSARTTIGGDTGWRVFPRYSVRVELLQSFRDDAGRPRDKFIWGTTYHPNESDSEGFWPRVRNQLANEKPDTRERIIGQVAEFIPLP